MRLGALGGFLDIDSALLAHGSHDDNVYTPLAFHIDRCGPKYDLLMSLPSSNIFLILSPTSPSGSLTSSLVVPASSMRERKSSSVTSS